MIRREPCRPCLNPRPWSAGWRLVSYTPTAYKLKCDLRIVSNPRRARGDSLASGIGSGSGSLQNGEREPTDRTAEGAAAVRAFACRASAIRERLKRSTARARRDRAPRRPPIRLRRIMLGLTQEAIAQRLQITLQQAHKYERGVTRISAARLLQFAEFSTSMSISSSRLKRRNAPPWTESGSSSSSHEA